MHENMFNTSLSGCDKQVPFSYKRSCEPGISCQSTDSSHRSRTSLVPLSTLFLAEKTSMNPLRPEVLSIIPRRFQILGQYQQQDELLIRGGSKRFFSFQVSDTFLSITFTFLVRFGQTKYQCKQTGPLYKNTKKYFFSHYDVIGELPIFKKKFGQYFFGNVVIKNSIFDVDT